MFRLNNLVKYGVLAASLTLGAGCAVEAGEDLENFAQVEQEASTWVYDIYTFKTHGANRGTWKVHRPIIGSSGYTEIDSFSFGVGVDVVNNVEQAADIPMVSGAVVAGKFTIATYGKRSGRLGRFYIDRDGDRTWSGPDTQHKFLSDAADTDKPFILYAQLWGKNSSNVCVARTQSGPFGPEPLLGLMVGIKRGNTIYLDRDGNGTFSSTSCDSQSTYRSSSTSAPVGVGHPQGAGETVFGTVENFYHTQEQRNVLRWYISNDGNISWNSPPDSSNDHFGDPGDYVPPSHAYGFSIKRGSTVYFDRNGDRNWSGSSDSTFANAIPSGYQFAGISGSLVVH